MEPEECSRNGDSANPREKPKVFAESQSLDFVWHFDFV
jgi:hypothetical protein